MQNREKVNLLLLRLSAFIMRYLKHVKIF